MSVASLLSGLFSSSQTASSSANGISPGSDVLTTNFNGYKSTLDSLVAFANPSSGVGQFFVPTGMIVPFAGPSLVTPPAGWLFCDGSAVPRTGTYADLFNLISTTYGAGNGSSTFNLPDLQGRTVVGIGTNGAVNALGDNEGIPLANVGDRSPLHKHSSSVGASATGTVSADQAAHSHGGSASSNNVKWRDNVALSSGTASVLVPFSSGLGAVYTVTSGIGTDAQDPAITASTSITPTVTVAVGTGAATNPDDTMPFLTLNYIIKY